MLNYVLAFSLILHGAMHFFVWERLTTYGRTFSMHIRSVTAWAWLTSCVLFILSGILLLSGVRSWPVFAIIAVIPSQLVIMRAWRATKPGSIANILIILVALPSLANEQFNRTTLKESKTILARVAGQNDTIVNEQMISHLPPVVQKWIVHSGVVGKEKSRTVRLEQEGALRTKPSGKWMHFNATEYFTNAEPSFIWIARVRLMPYIYMTSRDKFEDGHGEMSIKLLSLLTVARAENDKKTDSASLQRYLAEIGWFPSVAIDPIIDWQQVDSLSAKATIHHDGISVSGTFFFTPDGDLLRFCTNRYYNNGKTNTLTPWTVETISWKSFNGIRIPDKSKVSWELAAGRFNWYEMQLTKLEYNNAQLYANINNAADAGH